MSEFYDWLDAAKLGIIVTGVVALSSGWIQRALQKRSHRHEREMASDARNQERLASVYVDVLTSLRRVMAAVEGTYPVVGTGPDPFPEYPRGDDIVVLNARVAAFGSPTMKDLLSDSAELQKRFWAKAGLITDLEGQTGTAFDERFAIEEIRKEIRSSLTLIDAQAASELQGVDVDDILPAPIEEADSGP